MKEMKQTIDRLEVRRSLIFLSTSLLFEAAFFILHPFLLEFFVVAGFEPILKGGDYAGEQRKSLANKLH